MENVELGLRRRTVANIGYSAIARVVAILISALAGIVLARYLSVQDFGIYGFAALFVTLLSQVGDLGLGSAVVQAPQLDEEGLYTAFTLRFLIGLAVFCGTMVLAPVTRVLSSSYDIVALLRLLAITFLVSTFTFLPQTILTRNLGYARLSIGQVAASLANGVVAMVLAIAGCGYWSIAFGVLASAAANAVVLNGLMWIRPKLLLRRQAANRLLHFSSQVFASGLIIYAILNLDNLAIGLFKGPTLLGYYGLAFTWGAMLSGLISTVVLNVLFPTLSTIQGQREAVKRAYLEVLQYSAFLGFMIYVCLFVEAKDFLYVVLGHSSDKWIPAWKTLETFCIYGVLTTCLVPIWPVLMALGKVDVQLKATSIAAIVQTALLYPVLRRWGIEGVALLVTASYVLQYAIYYPALKLYLGLRLNDAVAAISCSLGASALTLMTGLWVRTLFPVQASWSTLIVVCAVCAATYIILHGLFGGWRLEGRLLIMAQVRHRRAPTPGNGNG